jgi:hypothetical protein
MDDMLFSSSGSEGMPEDYYLEREMTRKIGSRKIGSRGKTFSNEARPFAVPSPTCGRGQQAALLCRGNYRLNILHF